MQHFINFRSHPSHRDIHPRRSRLIILPVMALVLLLALFGFSSDGRSPNGGFGKAAAASDPVIAAAGDIACDPAASAFNGGQGDQSDCMQAATSNLLVNQGLAAVLPLGDNQYYCGSYSAYTQSYNLSWGRLNSISHPAVGNHEYLTNGGTGCNSSNANAAGYFSYFGAAAGPAGKGYYSYDVGTWHLIALNSSCPSGCGSGSAQYNWLKADLAAHPNQCTLAYWHVPLFSSGGRANSSSLPFWQLLYNAQADIVLNGHDHIYERFAPQTPSGTADPANGIREFIVGTGGSNHTTIVSIAANSVVRNATTFGVLELTLHAGSYDWKFIPISGGSFTDSGTSACHAIAPSVTPAPGSFKIYLPIIFK